MTTVVSLLAGSAAFALFVISDKRKLRGYTRSAQLFFALGGLLLCSASLALLLLCPLGARFAAHPFQTVLLGGCAVSALLLLIYALFFALPADTAYASADVQPVVSRGVYALCRHPGVLFLGLFYLFFFLLCETSATLVAGLLFTALDIGYVWWQDRVLFPRLIAGYAAYQQVTPFLLPNALSVQRCLQSLPAYAAKK